MRKIMLPTALAALVVASLAAPSAGAVADEADVRLVMASPENATLEVHQFWRGENAQDFRQSLDALFGNADGTLSREEVDIITQATEQDMMGQEFPLLSVDGEPATVQSASVDFQDAIGPVNAATDLEMVHEVELELAAEAGADAHQVVIDPTWNGTLTFEAPPDWFIVSAEGLENGEPADQTVTGELAMNETVTIELSNDPARAGEGTADEPADEPTDGAPADEQEEEASGPRIPGPGAFGIVGALAAAAAIFLVRSRARK